MSSYSDLLNETSYEGDNLTTNTLQVNTSTVLGYLSNSIIGVNASRSLPACRCSMASCSSVAQGRRHSQQS